MHFEVPIGVSKMRPVPIHCLSWTDSRNRFLTASQSVLESKIWSPSIPLRQSGTEIVSKQTERHDALVFPSEPVGFKRSISVWWWRKQIPTQQSERSGATQVRHGRSFIKRAPSTEGLQAALRVRAWRMKHALPSNIRHRSSGSRFRRERYKDQSGETERAVKAP
jgi:hypothetical protein